MFQMATLLSFLLMLGQNRFERLQQALTQSRIKLGLYWLLVQHSAALFVSLLLCNMFSNVNKSG